MRVEIVHRGICGPLPHQTQIPVEFGDAAGRSALVRSHLRNEESASVQRQEVVGDVGERAARREQESRTTSVRHIEEEDAVLTAEQRQQAATGQDVLVGGEMTMVRLVSGAAGTWQRDRRDDLAVAGRIFVEIDDRQEVRGDPGLVARPDVEGSRRIVVIGTLVPRRDASATTSTRTASAQLLRTVFMVLLVETVC